MSAVLVIAGTDPAGGAGLTRDVFALSQLRVEALCAVTAVTVQTDAAVSAIHHVPPSVVAAQIAAALTTGRARAVKIGMLGTAQTVAAVAAALRSAPSLPVVLDPVCAASSGAQLLDEGGREALLKLLLPRASLLTPNLPEAALLLGESPAHTVEEAERQGRALLARGPAAVLVKGGHAAGDVATDLLLRADAQLRSLSAARLATSRRGTGCVLASAIAAGLAGGVGLDDACEQAKALVTRYIAQGS